MEKDKKNMGATIGGILMVGCLMIGMGLGMYFHEIPTGMFVGLGVGFVAMGITWALLHKKQL